MYIHHKAVAAFYKLAIGAIALCLEWYLLGQFGWSAFRLFPVWVLILTAIYFLISALLLAINHRKVPGKNPSPVFEGMIIVNFILIVAVAILSNQHHFVLPHLETWVIWLICFVLPVMTFLDWALFVKKGRWKIMAPFYWLALPVCYVATMIFTADFMPSHATIIYPLEAFNYYNFGLWNFCELALTASVGILIVGYVLYLVDFVMSGKLAKHIVLPHIQTIEVEEEKSQSSNVKAPKNTESAKQTPDEPNEPNNPAKNKAAEVKHKDNLKQEPNPNPRAKSTSSPKGKTEKPNPASASQNSQKSQSASPKNPRRIKVNQSQSNQGPQNQSAPRDRSTRPQNYRKKSAAQYQRKRKR